MRTNADALIGDIGIVGEGGGGLTKCVRLVCWWNYVAK